MTLALTRETGPRLRVLCSQRRRSFSSRATQSLKETGKDYEIQIVGSRNGEVMWHQHSEWKLGNSIYLENTGVFRGGDGAVTRRTRRSIMWY